MLRATTAKTYARTELTNILEKLSAYRTFQCAQMHENILGIEKVTLPESGWQTKNLGFCSKDIRNATLGCAHSTSYSVYSREIEKLESLGIIEKSNIPMQEISDTITRIYLMDHEKSSLEKQRAVLREEQPDSALLGEMDTRLVELKDEHRQLVTDLGKYHRSVLRYLREKQEELSR